MKILDKIKDFWEILSPNPKIGEKWILKIDNSESKNPFKQKGENEKCVVTIKDVKDSYILYQFINSSKTSSCTKGYFVWLYEKYKK